MTVFLIKWPWWHGSIIHRCKSLYIYILLARKASHCRARRGQVYYTVFQFGRYTRFHAGDHFAASRVLGLGTFPGRVLGLGSHSIGTQPSRLDERFLACVPVFIPELPTESRDLMPREPSTRDELDIRGA